MSGKLGTRRAAVQYNIPRSTLRNKVYKMSMEAKRATPTSALLQHHHELDIDINDNKDLSGDDGEEDSSGDKCLSSSSLPSFPRHLQPQQGIDELASRIAANTLQQIQNIRENSAGSSSALDADVINTAASTNTSSSSKTIASLEAQSKRKTSTPASQLSVGHTPPQASPQMAPLWIDPNVLLQSILLSGGLGQLAQNLQPQHSMQLDENLPLRDLFSCLLMNSGCALKDTPALNMSSEARIGEAINNGKPNMIDPRILLQQLPLLQQHQINSQQQQHQSHHQQLQHHHQQQGGHSFQNRLPKSETSSVDLNETSDDPSVILKIPSYKPVAGSSSSVGGVPSSPSVGPTQPSSPSTPTSCNNSNKDSENQRLQSAPSPRVSTSMLTSSVPSGNINALPQHSSSTTSSLHLHMNNIPGISPPLVRQTSSALSGGSQSPPTLSLRDVIANSIHRTMNQQASMDAQAAAAAIAAEAERTDPYKKPSISVIKNIGGTDTSRFAAAPNVLHNSIHSAPSHHSSSSSHVHSHHSHHSQNSANNSLAGGKGTRPKRGKYRNYDRDSLVEAVKAVQRGEMSVHRAGSYYGVPHSTLEYKVKERHLMRPRKREPKPQPLDDRPGSNSSLPTGAGISSKTNSNIPGLSTVNNLDKLKSTSSLPSPSTAAGGTSGASVAINQKHSATLGHKNNNPPSAFTNTSPNGIKMPIFDPAVAAQLQYAPHLFWSHPAAAAAAAASGFGQLQIDFTRTSQGAPTASNTGNTSAFVNAETFLKSQMIQRFHEESLRASSASSGMNATNSPSPISSPMPSNNLHVKSTRELAENLYDTGIANGSSLLDGLIRKTLDRKNTDTSSHGALLDQLLVNNRPPYNHHNSDQHLSLINSSSAFAPSSVHKMKRTASPMSYSGIDIKRERASPVHTDEGSSSGGDDSEHNNGASSSSHRRSRNVSRDSDTDGSGKTGSDLLHPPQTVHHRHHHLQQQLQQQHHQTHHSAMSTSSALREDLNGGSSSSGGASSADLSSSAHTKEKVHPTSASTISSILHEKLGRIKAEHEDSL